MDPQSDVAERAPSRPLAFDAARKGPVFVDPSGRRGRLMRQAGAVAGAVCLGYSAVLGLGFAGGTALAPETLVPGHPIATEALDREAKNAPAGHFGGHRSATARRHVPKRPHSHAPTRPPSPRKPGALPAVAPPRPTPPKPAAAQAPLTHPAVPGHVPWHGASAGYRPAADPSHPTTRKAVTGHGHPADRKTDGSPVHTTRTPARSRPADAGPRTAGPTRPQRPKAAPHPAKPRTVKNPKGPENPHGSKGPHSSKSPQGAKAAADGVPPVGYELAQDQEP